MFNFYIHDHSLSDAAAIVAATWILFMVFFCKYPTIALAKKLHAPDSWASCIVGLGLFDLSLPFTRSSRRPRRGPCHEKLPSPMSKQIFLIMVTLDGLMFGNNLDRVEAWLARRWICLMIAQRPHAFGYCAQMHRLEMELG